MDYRKWRKVRAPLVLVTLGLLVVVLVPHLGVTSGGSSRWIGFGMLQLQPSELMKLALAVFAADLLTRRSHPATDPKMVIVPVLAVLGISGVLILKQPDMGTAMVLGCIAFGILFMGGVPMGPIIKILGPFVGPGRRGGPGRSLPAGPDPVLPQSRGQPLGHRVTRSGSR